MRISQDKDSWRAGGVLRRDFRATRGEPEAPTYHARRARPTPVRCRKSPTGAHVPERFIARITRVAGHDEHGQYHTITTIWGYRCTHCHTRGIAARLLAPVADVLDADELSRLLEWAWCREGHLFEVRRIVSSWGSTWPRHRCVMCGRVTELMCRYPEPTAALLRRAGVSEELLATANFTRPRPWMATTVVCLREAAPVA